MCLFRILGAIYFYGKMLLLVKINKEKYIEDMYENEYLYFNSLKGFRSATKDPTGRLDPRELNIKNKQLDNVTIVIKDKEYPLHEMQKFSAQFMEHLEDPKINCCSLYWLWMELNNQPVVDDRLVEMGDKALLIYDWQKFFEALDNSLEQLGLEYSRKKVTYYNPKLYDGDITLHHKDFTFEYQNEYRILVAPTDNKPINIPIPGLQSFSHILNSKELKDVQIKIN